jgi:all-trans-8'-apo-beta-carotenal 15,15'-oxygenase
VGRGTLTRLVITPWTGGVAAHRLMDRACEFPSVAPAAVGRPHTHAYMVGSRMDAGDAWGAPQVIVKTTLSPQAGLEGGPPAGPGALRQRVFAPGAGRWAQEPIFVPRPGSNVEDEGWVLVLVFDAAARRSELAILDAQSMERLATVRLPLMLPAGLHGSFTDDYLGPDPEQAYAPRKYDIRAGASRYE